MATRTGTIDFTVGNETFKTWYKVVGDLESATCPVVALHGGPGTPFRLLEPFMDLVGSHGLAIIFYDQIGAGNSTRLPDKPAEFWTVELFKDELDNVLHHFAIDKKFSLLGHSWGGMLAADYVSSRHPAGIQRLVIGSTPASVLLWEASMRQLLKRMPEDVREKIEAHERAGETDHPDYKAGMDLFYHRHICILDPWPEELTEAFAGLAENPVVYETM
jgi:proline-specific peptidase